MPRSKLLTITGGMSVQDTFALPFEYFLKTKYLQCIVEKFENYIIIFIISAARRPLLDMGLPQRGVFAIIATLGRRVGDRSAVVTKAQRTLLPILW